VIAGVYLIRYLASEEKGTDILNRISQFHYAVRNCAAHLQKPAKFPALLQVVEPIPYYCISGQHSYTRDPLADTNALSS